MSQTQTTPSPRDRGERIPSALVTPYIQAYIDSFEEGGGLILLAERTGFAKGTISKWLTGRRATIGFFDADLILTRLGDTSLWQTDPGLAAEWERASGLLQFDASEQEGTE